MSPVQPESPSALPSDNAVPLESVLCTEELNRRPARPPDFQTENRALIAMAQALTEAPHLILQRMAEIMLETLRADSSGISLLTKGDGGKHFYWPAIAGVWKAHIGGGTPREFGPCGDVLDHDAPLLFQRLERRYTYFQAVTPSVEEALLVPFYIKGTAVGTVWLLAHDDRRKFDAEDLRQLVSLSKFASAACQTWSFHEEMVAINESLMLTSLHQHELTDASDDLNSQLKLEIAARGITEKELAEKALELSEKARLIDLSNDGIIVRDLNDKIRLWNKGAEKLFGWSFKEVVGKDLHSLLQTEFPEPLEEIMAHLHREGRFNGEVVQIARDGRRVRSLCGWVLDRGTESIFTSYTDITERKLAEAALRESEERFRAATGTVSSLIWTNNAQGLMKGEQPGWGNFTGQTQEEYQDYGWSKAVHPEDAQATIDAWDQAVAEKRLFQFEHRVRRHDGDWRLCSIRAVPLFAPNGEIREWVGIHTDITERHRAEEALRASEEFNRSIVESNRDCIKVLDLAGNLISMSPLGQELLCIDDISPFLGKSWIEFYEGDDRETARAAVEAAAGGENANFVGFFRTLRGEAKWWDVVISPIRDAHGKIARLLAVSRDVTERQSLEKSLVARAVELARADRSKDEFLAMLAHELRNPLAPLRNAAEILQTSDASSGERHQALRIIGRQIENMSRMIDDLLDVSRITEGKIDLRRKPVALEAILTAATSLARSGCASHGQELEVSMPAEAVYLNADATRLEQVFANLLNNASKYGGDGCHITLRAERSTGVEPPEVIIRVQDNGVGIDPELLPRIFDLFVQSTRSMDRAHGGLGIGLTLVHRLVKLHGGTVEAHSDGLGQGSEFIVHLPILRHAPPAPAPPPAAARETSRRMLIVDDNTDSARSLAILQSRRGHVTRTAFTGPEAVAVAVEFLPEVVLLDIGLPGMDGFEVARRLRAMPELTGIFIVAMTGYASTEDRAEARRAGFDEHLVKPIDLDQLRDWLRTRSWKR